MKQRILLALCLLLFLLSACSHAQTASDVLPFRDGDVQAVEIYAQRPAPEGHPSSGWYYTELTDLSAIEGLLDNLRGMKCLSRFDGAHGVIVGDAYTFVFHLADGQLYTADLAQKYRTGEEEDEETAVFQCDLLRVKVEYVSDDFCASLDELAGDWIHIPFPASDSITRPYYGYSMPGDPPITADP